MSLHRVYMTKLTYLKQCASRQPATLISVYYLLYFFQWIYYYYNQARLNHSLHVSGAQSIRLFKPNGSICITSSTSSTERESKYRLLSTVLALAVVAKHMRHRRARHCIGSQAAQVKETPEMSVRARQTRFIAAGYGI